MAFPKQIYEDFLNEILSLGRVPQQPRPYAQYHTTVAIIQNLERLEIAFLQSRHQDSVFRILQRGFRRARRNLSRHVLLGRNERMNPHSHRRTQRASSGAVSAAGHIPDENLLLLPEFRADNGTDTVTPLDRCGWL